MIASLIAYLIECGIFHGLCYAAYWLFLRNSNHFSLNRGYLAGTVVVGFLSAWVTLPLGFLPIDPLVSNLHVGAGSFVEDGTSTASALTPESTSRFRFPFEAIYLIGLILISLRLVRSLLVITRIRTIGELDRSYKPAVVRIREGVSFSFLNTIFLRDSASRAEYLHEKGHVLGKHWVDLMVMEVVCAICWFNPVIWLYKRSIKQQHEYLADQYVLQQGVSTPAYLESILNSLPAFAPVRPVHYFNALSLKQRISMMTIKHSPYIKARYVAIAPLIAILFLSFTVENANNPVVADKVFVIDAAHGGSDAGFISLSGVREKDVALDLARQIQLIAKDKGLNVMLTRTEDKALTLSERVAFSERSKAVLFLSLHFGAQKEGGTSLYVSDQNGNLEGCKKIAALLDKELHEIEALKPIGLHQSDALVLKQGSAASLILEISDLSSEQDSKFVVDKKNQRKIAEKIVDALVMY